VWKPDGETRGGFYVWVGDQLVGEALTGTTDARLVDVYKNALIVGDLGREYSVSARIDALAVDAKNAFAPENLPAQK